MHPIQKEIIDYNLSLGDTKRMQISISQCQFLHLIIKVSKIKKVLEIGTFTGLSTLSMALALPDEGSIIALDKNEETNKVAQKFFKKGNQDHKIKTIIKPALETLMSIRDKKFDNDDFIKMGENIQTIKLNSIRDNKKFDINAVEILYSLPVNSFTLVTDEENNIFLAKIINFQNEVLNDEKIEEYASKQNSNIKNTMLKSYDLFLNDKYDVVLNQKTIERVKNFFQ